MNRVITASSIAGAVAVALFVSIEIVIAAGAAGWAITGLLSLGATATLLLAGLLAVPSLYAIVRVAILAFDAETDPVNN